MLLLRILEYVVGADAPPDHVRLAVEYFISVMPRRAPVGRPSQLVDTVVALDSLDSEPRTRLSACPQIFDEIADGFLEAGTLIVVEFRVVT
jgi:hypothetical protein